MNLRKDHYQRFEGGGFVESSGRTAVLLLSTPSSALLTECEDEPGDLCEYTTSSQRHGRGGGKTQS